MSNSEHYRFIMARIGDNRLSWFTLLFPNSTSFTPHPPSIQSQLPCQGVLWDAVADSKSSLWQHGSFAPSLNLCVCLSESLSSILSMTFPAHTSGLMWNSPTINFVLFSSAAWIVSQNSLNTCENTHMQELNTVAQLMQDAGCRWHSTSPAKHTKPTVTA